jgi:molybdopterin converting factor small subunit
MPVVRFTANIQRHVACPALEVGGGTVRAALDAYFVQVPGARGYVLDDQGRLRKHMVAFIDGRQVEDRDGLADAVAPAAELDIVQALSGG